MNQESTDSPQTGKRHFVNYFEVGFNQHELLLNLGQHYENDNGPVLHTHLVTAPAYAKKLLLLLELSVRRYEDQFGEIGQE